MNEFMFFDKENKNNFSNTQLDNLPLAMAYVPMQKYENLYHETEALYRGTLFADLDKPFCGKFVK